MQATRTAELKIWLSSITKNWQLDLESLTSASIDASFRSYFRIRTNKANYHSLIVMDAPPALEDCRPFIKIANLFSKAKIHVPEVLAENISSGFLLLSDLGDTTYLKALKSATKDGMHALYTTAINALLKIQSIKNNLSLEKNSDNYLPKYSEELLKQELKIFEIWYLEKHLQLTLSLGQKNILEQIYEILIKNATNQAYVCVHRDYHSRNLMQLPLSTYHFSSNLEPGILDFQDAVIGPISYDLASLFKDAYFVCEEAQTLGYLRNYWHKAMQLDVAVTSNWDEFYYQYELMALQRHLKILGIFARLHYRDGKSTYLSYIPTILNYVHAVISRYSEFHQLLTLISK